MPGPDSRRSVPELIELVKKEIDGDQSVADYQQACAIRNEAAWALGRIGKDARQAVPVLRAVLITDGSPYFRRRAMDAIRLIESGK